ncbi:Uncharacterised protein r2_g2287 [Pycnogonum litorale]
MTLVTAGICRQQIRQRFEDYVQQKSNFRVARFQLQSLKQDGYETMDAFMTRAKTIAVECEYTDTDDMLIDALISGVYNQDIKRKLFAKDKTLTLEEATQQFKETTCKNE